MKENEEQLPKPYLTFWLKLGQSLIINPGQEDEKRITVEEIAARDYSTTSAPKDFNPEEDIILLIDHANDQKTILRIHAPLEVKILREKLINDYPYTRLFGLVKKSTQLPKPQTA